MEETATTHEGTLLMEEHCSGLSFSLTRLALTVLLVGATLPTAAHAETKVRIGMTAAEVPDRIAVM